MPEEPKTQTLTVNLIPQALSTRAEIISTSPGIDVYTLELAGGRTATLYVRKSNLDPPDWAAFLRSYVDPAVFGDTGSAGAVLVLPSDNRFFAITFGTGRFLLQPSAVERSFGLKVTLNCIGENTLRSIDKDSLDRLSRHTREQASRNAAAREFGLDIEQDLLRAVTGEPVDKTAFGERITGRDALTLSLAITIDGLPELVDSLLEEASRTTYRQNFPWVDHLGHVTDKREQEMLDSVLIEKLKTEEHQHAWMAVPEAINWERVRGFRFPSRRVSPEYPDIHLDHFLESLEDIQALSRDSLNKVVQCTDLDGNRSYRWKVYQCLYCELDYQGGSFVLSGGAWYRVDAGFVERVNAAYDEIPNFDRELPPFEDVSEGAYIQRISQAAPTRFAPMDQKTVTYGGGHSKIEFCDAYTDTRDVLHVKRYGQASALSHLFAQGLTFGEVFQTDPALRERFNELVPESYRIPNPRARPQRDEYRVVYAIVSDRPGDLVLPFFSRLNIKHAARRLEAYGYRVAKAKIAVAENFGRVARIPARRRRA